MDSLTRRARLSITGDGRIELEGVDLTDKIERLAFEIADDGCWLSFQVRAEVADKGIELPFPANTVTQHLGGGGKLQTSPAEIEQMIVSAMGYSSAPDACGKAIFDWLAANGVVAT